jgi:hypothetical protein
MEVQIDSRLSCAQRRATFAASASILSGVIVSMDGIDGYDCTNWEIVVTCVDIYHDVTICVPCKTLVYQSWNG